MGNAASSETSAVDGKALRMIALNDFYLPEKPITVCPCCKKHKNGGDWLVVAQNFNVAGKTINYVICPACRLQKKSAVIHL